MFQEFRHIRLSEAADVDYILRPQVAGTPITLHSPAVEVLTDFNRIEPVRVSEQMPIDAALEYMRTQHVRMLFVVDKGENFSGVVTTSDISGRKVLAYMQQAVISRDQVQVRHVMLSKLKMQALSFDQLQDAKVGDVMLTLKGYGAQHVVVLDQGIAGVNRVRGVISSSDISRKLKIGFEVMHEAKSFAEIERIISHGSGL